MIKVTTEERANKVKTNLIGFDKGKVVIVYRNQLPWHFVEITPDKLEFESIYVDENDIKGDAIKATATLNRTPELEAVFEEAVKAKMIPFNILDKLRKNGSVHYGVIAFVTTQEQFMDMNILRDGCC